jgi:hypothetical protein
MAHKIDTRNYVNTHGKAPANDAFGIWILVRDDKGSELEISRTCYWRQLKNVKLSFRWTLKP